MRILAGGIIHQDQAVLEAHLKTLRRAAEAADAEVDFVFLVDPEAPEENAEILPGLVEEADPKPEDANYSVDEVTLNWTEENFFWLGRQRQKILQPAADNHYDGVFLVDSDLLLGPETLQSRMECGRPITSAVLWTRWQPDSPPLPQVWLAHPYQLSGRGLSEHEFLRKLANRELTEVGGLGACTLIRSEVFGEVGYYPPLPDLPSGGMWQGEDRHFCVRAERAHVGLWADAWPDVYHAYRPSDAEHLDQVLERLLTEHAPTAEIGDLVSAKIEPLQEDRLSGHAEFLRGRLGTLRVLPEIEKNLQEMEPGEDRIVDLDFPLHYRIPQYRGQSRLVRLRLIDHKPCRAHPNLEDEWTTNTSLPLSRFYERSERASMKKAKAT